MMQEDRQTRTVVPFALDRYIFTDLHVCQTDSRKLVIASAQVARKQAGPADLLPMDGPGIVSHSSESEGRNTGAICKNGYTKANVVPHHE